MVWLLGLTGPAGLVAVVLAQASNSNLTETLVAFGVITGLSGAVVKLWSELQRSQRKIEEAAQAQWDRTMPVVGEAIAEVRETRRERQETREILEDVRKLLREQRKRP